MKAFNNLIFDYDGTLHNANKVYAPAFRKAFNRLIELGYQQEGSTISDEEIGRWLGYSSLDTWNQFMPELPLEIKESCSEMITQAMLEGVRTGLAELYPGSLDCLAELKEAGYTLIFLSNCRRAYMEAHIGSFELDRYFSGFYCTQDFGFKPKYEIFETIRRDFEGGFAVIGDRFHDMELAVRHRLFCVGCAYGYGTPEELEEADVIVEDVREIPAVILNRKQI